MFVWDTSDDAELLFQDCGQHGRLSAVIGC